MVNFSTPALNLILFLLHCALAAENSSDQGGATGFCDETANCGGTQNESPNRGGWKPFVTEAGRSRWHDFERVLKVYAKWHDETLYDFSIKCSEKKALVFTPNAGLGDSVGALTSAFLIAIKQGRLVKLHIFVFEKNSYFIID